MTRRDWSTYRVGLTGGIASGKSLVAALFAGLGVPVIDADEIAHRLTDPGSPALRDIAGAFGQDILTPDGRLDRRRLREIVFADPGRRRQLESLLHPRVLAALETRSAGAGGPYQLLVVPLLFESGFDGRVDRTLVVDCPEEIQRARLLARDHETPAGVDRILAAQMARADRTGRADDILRNEGSLEDVRDQVAALHATYLRLARTR